jgi:hypothetical protein
MNLHKLPLHMFYARLLECLGVKAIRVFNVSPSERNI